MKTTPKQITIKTLTPKYDLHEDRIRLSLNYNDLNNRIDMMLTRSFLLKMLPSIEEYTYKYYPQEPIEEELSSVELTQQIQSDKINKKQKNKSSYLSSTNTDDLELYKGIEKKRTGYFCNKSQISFSSTTITQIIILYSDITSTYFVPYRASYSLTTP